LEHGWIENAEHPCVVRVVREAVHCAGRSLEEVAGMENEFLPIRMDLHDPCQADEVLRMLLMEVQWNIRGFRPSCVHREEPTAGVPAAGSEGVDLLVGLVAIAPSRLRDEGDFSIGQCAARVGACL